jgi:hypothetical protein
MSPESISIDPEHVSAIPERISIDPDAISIIPEPISIDRERISIGLLRRTTRLDRGDGVPERVIAVHARKAVAPAQKTAPHGGLVRAQEG